MATKLKIYDTHDSRPGASSRVLELLGGLNHNQVVAYTMATSKVAAAERVTEAGALSNGCKPHQLRIHDVGTVQIYVAAGLFSPEAVLVAALVHDDVVVAIDHENTARVAGRYSYEDQVRQRVFRTADGRGFYYQTGTGEVHEVP